MDIYERFVKTLDILRKNELQMNAEQKKEYADALTKKKRLIVKDAAEVIHSVFVGGIRFAEREIDPADWRSVIRKIEQIINEWDASGSKKKAYKVLLMTYDPDTFFKMLEMPRLKIWYEAYGPYWLDHCKPTGDPGFPYANDIIGMEWSTEDSIWMKTKVKDGQKVPDSAKGWTVMLPPTKDALEAEYKEEMGEILNGR